MRFEYWPAFLLLLMIPALHRWWLNRNRPARVTYSLPIPSVVASRSPVKFLLFLKYVGLIFLVIALARPQASFKQIQRTVSGVDIMLLLDVSASMNVEDLGAQSRLDIAKETLQSFVRGRRNDRIGFVMFSGEALTMAPPTLDYGLLSKAIMGADTGVLRDGTAIGDGLALALSHLKESKAKSRIVILLTDGDNNLGQVDPATAGEMAAGFGVKVYTIAIGTEGRVKLPIRHRGAFGNTITTYQIFENALNPELLQQISKRTEAKFYRVTDEKTLDSVFKEIDQLEKTEIKTHENIRYEERFAGPLKLGMFTLMLERVLAQGWWRMIP